MEINLWEIGLHVINTVILFVALRFLIYKPVVKFLKAREDRVNKQQEDAKEALRLAEEKRFQSEKLIDEAQNKASTLIKTSSEHARSHGEEIIKSAQQEADDLKTRALKELEKEKKYALQSMKDDIVDLSVRIAAKVLQRELTKEDNEKLVNEFFDRVN
jgi:F-type H+-transporting ATPase subunit b